MRVGRIACLGAALAAAACVEQLTAPGRCPDYCPPGQISVVDTLLRAVIGKDSAFRGYVTAYQAPLMLAAELPAGYTSRPIFRFNTLGLRMAIRTTDTTTGAILSADSARLQLSVARRDTAARNVTLSLYKLPVTIDSTTTFVAMSTQFAAAPLRTVNLDALHAQPGKRDSVSGDSTFKDPVTGDSLVIDTTNHRLLVSFKLNATQVQYVAADTGKVAYGVRISATPTTRASLALGKGDSPSLRWYVVVDSVGTPVKRTPALIATVFSSFIFVPPTAQPDSTLAVGGIPAARSILRVTLPRAIRDSSQVLRATLVLVPAVAARGAPADSFAIEAHTVLADFGAKSPIILDAARTDTAMVRPGATDTVRIEVTNLLQFWQADTTRAATIVLRTKAEGSYLGEIHFYPSLAAPYRPALAVTYAPRFPFGKP